MQFPPEKISYPMPLTTQPPSPGKRRRFLRESEDIDGEMSLEDYLYRSDPFRSSTFKHPWPLPLMMKEPEVELRLDGPRFRPFLPEILSILDCHSIEKTQRTVMMCMISKPGFPGGDTEVLALVLVIDQGLQPKSNWASARDGLRELFSINGFPKMMIEIYDLERAFMPTLFPLKPQDPMIELYESKRPQLLAYIRERLGITWSGMSIFGVGSMSGKIQPALTILIKPGTQHSWKNLEQGLTEILSDHSIQVEFLPGNISVAPGDDQGTFRRGKSLMQQLQQYPSMGSSIGESGRPGSGTMGGTVTLQEKGTSKKVPGILTTHHVVKPFGAKPEMLEPINRYGYGFGIPDQPTTVQYLSADDMKETKDDIRDQLSCVNGSIHGVEAVLAGFAMKEQDPPKAQKLRLGAYKRQQKHAEEKQDLLDRLPMQVGRVAYSSGEMISANNTILDWAFVETAGNPDFHAPNRLPESDKIKHLASSYKTGEVNYRVTFDKPQHAQVFSEIEKGKWYFKIGRTTGITTGVCHGTKVDIQRPGEIRWSKTGKAINLGETTTREFLIMGLSAEIFSGDAEAFVQLGDSGSFVVNSFGEVAGLLYGQLTSYAGRYTNAGLVTSMDEVVASIEEKTNCTLELF